jgi:putative oxidoreductase
MILSGLGRFKDFGLLLLRLGIGTSFVVVHGWPKLSGGVPMWTQVGGAMGNLGVTWQPALWGALAALSEFVGGICFILGFAFRPACIVMGFTMFVAATMHLMTQGFGEASNAIECLAVFVGLLFVGPGKYSIDKK